MGMDNIELLYKKEIIERWLKYGRELTSGELFYKEVSLEDIFTFLRLYSCKESERILNMKSSSWDMVYKENKIIKGDDINDKVIRDIDQAMSFQEGILYDDTILSFDSLITFIDKQLSIIKKEDYKRNDINISGNINNLVENNYTDFDRTIQLTKDDSIIYLEGDTPSRRIVLSDPGCGKTTLINRIALAYAKNDTAFKKQYGISGDLFPVLIYCRSQDDDEFELFDNFISVIISFTKKEFYHFTYDEELFKALIIKHAINGTLILLIDGIDEMLQKKQGERFVSLMCSFLDEYTKVHLILTSRIATFCGSDHTEKKIISMINNIKHIKKNCIALLNREEINSYIKRWYEVYYPYGSEKNKLANQLIKQLNSSVYNYLDSMICVPLHLSNILLITRDRDGLPHNKSDLWYEYVDLSLNWHATGNIDEEDVRNQLGYVAYSMKKKGNQRITIDNLKNKILECYNSFDGEFTNQINDSNVIQLIKEIEERTCLIKRCASVEGVEIYEFAHLNLQEYFVAYAIVKGCFEDFDEYSPLQIIKDNYTKSAWKEVVVLMLLQLNIPLRRNERYSIIDFLVSELDSPNNNQAANLLFELIANGVKINPDRRYLIYDHLFKDKIDDFQIRRICDFLKVDRLDEFKKYVYDRFHESLESGDCYYALAFATVRAYEILGENKNPLEEAEQLVLQNEDARFVEGVMLFIMLAWCKYSNVKSDFGCYDISLKNDFSEKIIHQLMCNTRYRFYISTAIKEIILAQYIEDLSFFNLDLFLKMIDFLNSEDKQDKDAGERILSVYPITMETLSFQHYKDIHLLRENYYKKYINNDTEMDDLAFVFNICSMLGCWSVSSNTLLSQFVKLEGLLRKNNKTIKDESIVKCEMLKNNIYSLPRSPIQKGFAYYNAGDYNNAKICFLTAYNGEEERTRINLAYMLRRKEIYEVKINGHLMSVERLLDDGVNNNDPYAIINYILYITLKENEIAYNKGLALIRDFEKNKPGQLKVAYDNWWRDLAERSEIEGLLVMAWLLEVGLLDEESSFENLYNIKKKLSTHRIFDGLK